MDPSSPASPREAILMFHYADRMKSELIIASQMLTAALLLKEAEQFGGRRVLVEYFKALEREVALGQAMINDPELVRVRTVMTGLTGMADSGPLNQIQEHLTWVISIMTTYAQRAMKYLMDQDLL
jgi:nicotinate-nucleotide pyrophosphorylase